MMKRLSMISVVAATLMLSGCWNDTKEAAKEATSKATESVKEATSAVAETAKTKAAEAMDKAAESVKEAASGAVEGAKEAASKALDSAKAAAGSAAQTAATVAGDAVKNGDAESAASTGADTEKGKALYAKCAGCHGADGKTKALGKSEIIAGKSAEEIEKMLHEYKAGTRNVAGMGMLMKGQVAAMSDEDIKAISAYIATFK